MNAVKVSLPGIKADDLERAAKPLEEAWTLPAAAYTNPEIGELEKERVLRQSWLPVARVEQIEKPGDFLCIDLLDQPLMIVHGHDGEIRVMSRVCLHRGAPIAEGAGNKKLFVCPYHAWSYTNDGKLKKAPLMDGARGFDESNCRLPEVRTEIWNGFILVNFDDDADDLAPQLEGFDDLIANYRPGEMHIAKTLEFDSHWNWKVLVENFMEAYHHIAIHSRTFEPSFHARDSKVIDDEGQWSVLHMPAAKAEAPPGLPLIDGLEDWQKTDLIAAAVFPYFLLAFQGNSAVWYEVQPISQTRLTLKIHVLVPESTLEREDAAELIEESAMAVNVIHHEDIGANDMVWKGLNAPLTKQGRLSPLERSIWHLNQWWIAKMQAPQA